MKKLIIAVAFAIFGGDGLFAQALAPRTAFVVNLDYARFRNTENSGYLEIYYGFYPDLLTLMPTNRGYQGGVVLSTRITDNASNALVINKEAVLPIVISDTSSASFQYPSMTQTGHYLPYGHYTLKVIAADSLNPSRRDSITRSLVIQAYPASACISDLELSSQVQSSEKKDDPFYKNSLEVIPDPMLVFGVATHPVVFSYAELYNLNTAMTYTLKNQIVLPDGKIVKESVKSRKYEMPAGVESGMIRVTSTESGRYVYRLSLLDENDKEVASSEKTFYVYNPHLKSQVMAGGVSLVGTQLAGLSTTELDEEFGKAKYLVTKDEIKLYAQLKADDGKREFLTKLWSAVEAGRGDYAPIKRSEYLRRAEAATKNFSASGKVGWRSDRGRVYMLYGEPDQIEQFPSEAESRPYQRWHYRSVEKGVEFIFVDRFGAGDYQLVHSTKRGELQDEGWERFLL